MPERVDTLPTTPRRDSPGSSKLRLKKRASTLEKTKEPRSMELAHSPRPAMAGILELCHSIGESEWSAPEHAEVIRIRVYFQTYSPEKTK